MNHYAIGRPRNRKTRSRTLEWQWLGEVFALSSAIRRITPVILGGVLAIASFVSPADARDLKSKATLDVMAMSPSPGAQVSKSTIVKVTLHYMIEDFSGRPGNYRALLLFDSPANSADSKTYSSDYGCLGAMEELAFASGTVNLECRLKQLWGKFRRSSEMVISFVVTQRAGGMNSVEIAHTEKVRYDIQR